MFPDITQRVISMETRQLTQEQEEVLTALLQKVEESKKTLMRCIICDEMTHERGLVCVGPAPASTIICGLCYPCKNLPDYEKEVQRRVRDFLISIGREDLLQ
jgi:recombinational DNA repair protein RecR